MSILKQIPKQSLSDRVYMDLRTALMDGQFEPGDRLKISALSEELGVSLTPVREALFRLVSEQALTMKTATAIHVPVLDAEDLLQVKLIRLSLEGDAAAAAAAKAPPKLLRDLRALQDDFLDVVATDAKRASQLNRQFHFQLAEASGWDIVMHTIASMWAMIGPVLNEFHRTVPTRELSGEHRHEAVLAALEAKDPEAARQAIRHDIEWGDRIIDWLSKRQVAE
ncbi:GntR family transcriptional regulator [Pacificoceanicola onchidii]|uniref:GntR family transcriptional regulator n=1 Tax=Pacificoceanicola onchidii TaxID=2562685 RepID=UPI0010A63B33|nr:GntR family transcriptional regulator [Pacificoceanicola onchidii]